MSEGSTYMPVLVSMGQELEEIPAGKTYNDPILVRCDWKRIVGLPGRIFSNHLCQLLEGRGRSVDPQMNASFRDVNAVKLHVSVTAGRVASNQYGLLPLIDVCQYRRPFAREPASVRLNIDREEPEAGD
jgi:hypothetical protein